MAGKRKTRQAGEDLSKPTKWRLQHGGLGEPVHHADPATGAPVVHHRAVDTLGLMLANGTISPEMFEAAAMFRAKFRTAALDGIHVMPVLRISGNTGDGLTEHQMASRERVAAAIMALGGFDSAAGSVVWHVVGLESSVREWAMRQGWGGRRVAPPHAQGMLVAALSTLAGHYGLTRRRRAA